MASDKVSKRLYLRIFTAFLLFPLYFAEYSSSYGYPNIIIFFIDNLSLGDLNIFGRNSLQTPNTDSLIDEGVVFSRWYAQSSSLSSRASILTGLLPPRTGTVRSKFLPLREFPSIISSGGLQQKEITVAEVLQGRGYATGFVGLWDLGLGHKGEYLPINQGFDTWYGVPAAHKDYCLENYKQNSARNHHQRWYLLRVFLVLMTLTLATISYVLFQDRFDWLTIVFCHALFAAMLLLVINAAEFVLEFIHTRSCVLYRDSHIIEQPYSTENMTLRFTREAVRFVESSAKTEKPFFLFVSYMKLNHPLFVSRLFNNLSSTQNSFSNALCELDWSIGKIIRTLKLLNHDDNTLILFTSSTGHHDNEAHNAYGLVHSIGNSSEGSYLKGTRHNDVWEGTIRVPTVIRWKRHLSGRQMINSTVTSMDVVPTVLELLNYSADALESDGKSLLPLLLNTSSRESLHKFVFHYMDITKPAAVTFGPYKAIYTEIKDDGNIQSHDPPLLFNVELDPGETLPLPYIEYSSVQTNISAALEEHMATRKNKWHSHLDSAFVAYYFPCAHPPHCHQGNNESADFTDLFV